MNEPVIIALIGVLGSVVGSLATLSGNILLYYLNAQAARRLDKPRIKLLKDMLENPLYKWRKLDTLMHVIGADELTTKNLLLIVGARASEDGQQLWGLLSSTLPERKSLIPLETDFKVQTTKRVG